MSDSSFKIVTRVGRFAMASFSLLAELRLLPRLATNALIHVFDRICEKAMEFLSPHRADCCDCVCVVERDTCLLPGIGFAGRSKK